MKRKKYGKPLLDTPAEPKFRRLVMADDMNKENQKIEQENIDRERALFEYFGETRPDQLDASTRSLIHKMAAALNIAGFLATNEVQPVGRKPKWRGFYADEFVKRVEQLRLKKPSWSVQQVINSVKRKFQYIENPKSLLTRYNELITKSASRTKTLHEDILNAETSAEKQAILDNFHTI